MVICLSNLLSPVTFFILRKAPVKGYFICSLLGSLLQAIGCISSSFVTYVPWMFLTFSLLFGFGSSLVLISSSLVISTFFPPSHQHHIFATATFQCAFPIGQFCRPFKSCFKARLLIIQKQINLIIT